MQREQNLWGLQCLLWPAHAKLLIYAADSVLAFQFQAPTRFKNACCLFNCVSSTVYHSPHCYTVLNGFWTCPYIICLRFFAFFPHTSFYAFSHLRIPFFCFLLFLLFIFITVFLYPIFPRTCFIALNFILSFLTSLLLQNSCYHAYFDHLRMVSS